MKEITTVDDYLANCPVERQEVLTTIRKIIQEVLPEAEETIKYGMPTYHQKENLVHFSNAKHHIGFYPTPSAIVAFAEQLSPYKTSKGAVQFPVSQAIPYELIKEMTAWRLAEVLEKNN